jgi:hypothetical protein
MRSPQNGERVHDGAEERTALYLKFYAEEDDRAWWLRYFPDDVMPAHEDPPYDRDRSLPKRIWPEP